MKGRVLIPQDIAPAGKQFLLDQGYELVIGSGYSDECIKKEIVDCDAVIVRNFPFTKEMILAGKNLKVIARHGVGLDNIDVKAATELGIQVVFAPESNAISVAEHTLGFILAAAHQFPLCDRETKKGHFEFRHTLNAHDIEGKTLGIIGFGRIGKLVAQKAKNGLGMRVIVYDPFLGSGISIEYEKADSLQALLPACDYVTLHIPLSEETRNLIGKNEFQLMKKDACIINAARGGIINENDLYDALVSHTIAMACLDVFVEEPVNKNLPLLSLDNIIVTPHSATLTKECVQRMGMHAAMGIDEVLTGKTPTWPVNKL